MRQNKYFGALTALCALALTVSCQREIQQPEQEPTTTESRAELRTFTCVIGGGEADSKVAIDAEGKTTWEVGDEILIHGERLGTSGGKQYSTIVTLTADDISSNGKTATITVATDPDGINGIVPYVHMSSGVQDYESTLYAAYPASAIDMSVGHCYYHNPFEETNLPLMIAYDDGNSFVFNPVGSVISFTLPASLDFDTYAFSGNNGEIVGYDRFTAKAAKKSDGSISEYYPYTSGDISDPVSGPKTAISAPVVCDGATLNQVCIPGKLEFTKGFKILFLKDGEVVKCVSNKGHFTLKRGDYLPLGDISSHLKDYTEAHTSSIPTEGAIDLGENGTANSYIVYASSAPGAVYKFKAVKGNSTTEVGSIASVDILWETWNNAETVTQHSVVAAADFEGDYIYIQMPETLHAGNAVIAARNAGGVIRWSWHIWVPSTEIETHTHGIYDKGLMDRNLGALVAATADDAITIESFGLNYQWGRKDPFVGAKAMGGSSSNATVAGLAPSVAEGDGLADESKMTLDQSIQNPTLIGHSQNGDWVTPSDNSLWKNVEKTIYDPCPPGYRVPARDKNQPWHSADLTAVTGWAEATNWFTLGNPVAVFPFAGYRDDYAPGSVTHAYDRSVYWTAYASSDGGGTAYYVSARLNTTNHKLTETGKSRSGSVRCVTEETFIDPVEPSDYPVMTGHDHYLKLRVDDNNYVPELSGLCLSKDKDFLWGCDDNGGLYKINFDGSFELWYDKSGEWEDLCMDPDTYDIYVGLEDEEKSALKLPYSGSYKSKTNLSFVVEGASDMGNSGIEGIAWYKGDLYLGSQDDAILFHYTLDGTLKGKKSLQTVCPTISEIAGLDYDEERDWLWVIDSNGEDEDHPEYEPYSIYLFTGDGSQMLARYYIGDFADWNPEAICVDKAHGCIWVGEDCGDDKFSLLHKVYFSGL